jgi:hypothetical protein
MRRVNAVSHHNYEEAEDDRQCPYLLHVNFIGSQLPRTKTILGGEDDDQ